MKRVCCNYLCPVKRGASGPLAIQIWGVRGQLETKACHLETNIASLSRHRWNCIGLSCTPLPARLKKNNLLANVQLCSSCCPLAGICKGAFLFSGLLSPLSNYRASGLFGLKRMCNSAVIIALKIFHNFWIFRPVSHHCLSILLTDVLE